MPTQDFGIVDTSIQEFEDFNDIVFGTNDEEEEVVVEKPPVKTPPAKTPEKTTPQQTEIQDDEDENSHLNDEEEVVDETSTTENEEEEDNSAEEDENDEKFNQFQALSKNLYEIGIFSYETDEEGNPQMEYASTPEEFKTLWEDQKAKALDQSLYNFLMNKHGEEGIEVFRAIFQDGVNPKEYLSAYSELQDLSGLDVENNESHQELVVREHLKESGWKPDKIDARITKLKNRAELQEEAEMIYPELLESRQKALLDKQEAAKQKAERKANAEKQASQLIMKTLNEAVTAKEIDGVPITLEKANALATYVNKKLYTDRNDPSVTYSQFDVDIMNLKRKPENVKKLLKLAALLQNGLDLTSVAKKSISKQSNSLFKEFALKKDSKKTSSQQNTQKLPSAWNGMLK